MGDEIFNETFPSLKSKAINWICMKLILNFNLNFNIKTYRGRLYAHFTAKHQLICKCTLQPRSSHVKIHGQEGKENDVNAIKFPSLEKS